MGEVKTPPHESNGNFRHEFPVSEDYAKILRQCRLLVSPSTRVLLASCPEAETDRCLVRIHVENSERTVLSEPVLATAVALPLPDNSVDLLLCVKDLLNQWDVAVAMAELNRVIRPGGHLLVEYESSLSLELLGQNAFGRAAGMVEKRDDNGQRTMHWVYGPAYLKNLLRALDFRPVLKTSTQLLPPGGSWLLGHNLSIIRRLESIARLVPGSTRWASRQLVVCQKSI